MNTLNIIVAFLSAMVLAKNENKDRVKTACKTGNFEALKGIQCTDIKRGWFKKCLQNKNFNKDGALAEAIKRCPGVIPEKKRAFEKTARRLFKYNQLQSLRVLLADGRCKNLSKGFRNFLLRDQELNVVAICNQQAAPIGIIPGVAPATNITAPGATPTGTAAATTAAPVAPVNAVEGSVQEWDEAKVAEKKDLLAAITQEQAASLGQCNNACLALTAEHFSHPAVKPAVVASLSVRCFRNVPPAAFAGLTKDQVKVMTIWPFIRRSQLRAIKPQVIVAVPFDQLGVGKQQKKNADRHACFGITKHQLKAIKKDKKAHKLYKYRCIKNAARAQAPSGFTSLAVALGMAMLLVL